MLLVRLKLDELQVILARKNLSQNMLAMRAGISSGYFSQIMHGERKPSPRLRQRLQDALGVSFDELFVIEESPDGDGDTEGGNEG